MSMLKAVQSMLRCGAPRSVYLSFYCAAFTMQSQGWDHEGEYQKVLDLTRPSVQGTKTFVVMVKEWSWESGTPTQWSIEIEEGVVGTIPSESDSYIKVDEFATREEAEKAVAKLDIQMGEEYLAIGS